MGLRREVDDAIRVMLPQQPGHQGLVANVAVDENVPPIPLRLLQVLHIARIGEGVQVDNADIRIFPQQIQHHVGADKPGAAGDQIRFHQYRTFPSATDRRCAP